MISQEITLNAWRQNQVSLVAVQGESNSRTIAATLLDNGSPIDLTGCTARLYIEKPDKSAVFCDGTVIDSINGVASFVLPYQATAQYGDSECAIIITGPAKDLRVVGLTLQVSACNLEGAAESTDEFSSLTNALKEVDSLAENLEGLSADAAAQAGYARTQGDYAKNQGDFAKTQAVAAQTAASSASSAANSARTAASSANTAATSANSAAERANAEADRCEALDISALDINIKQHAASQSNPHAVTAAQVGARPSSWTPTYSQIGAAPTTHTSTSTTYGAGTYSSYGHMRFAGNGGSSHYAIPINSTTTTLSTLDTTTYLYTGVYDIAISSSTSGAAGIEGLSSTAVRATLTALPPNNITGLAASASGVEQILSIPKLQKTNHRYCRVTGTEYGTWKQILDINILPATSGFRSINATYDYLFNTPFWKAGISTFDFIAAMPVHSRITAIGNPDGNFSDAPCDYCHYELIKGSANYKSAWAHMVSSVPSNSLFHYCVNSESSGGWGKIAVTAL